MKIIVQVPFVSRKTEVHWPNAGMNRNVGVEWKKALNNAVQPHEKELRELFRKNRELKVTVKVYDKPNKIRLLDIHDALAQTIDQITDILFPRDTGKPTPQTQDRHFWQVEAEKKIDPEPKVLIEIVEI